MVIDLVSAGFGVGLVHPASAHWRTHSLCAKPFVPAIISSYCLSYRNTGNLAAFNLLDKKYLKHTSAAGHAESSNLASLQEAGRTFNASVSYLF